MDDIVETLQKTSSALGQAIEEKAKTTNGLSSALQPIIARLDKIVMAIASAHSEDKIPAVVCVDEVTKLRKDLTAALIEQFNGYSTLVGQKAGIEASFNAISGSNKVQERESLESENVQRTKERIESGDLNLDRPRSIVSRPETLKNVRKAQEQITEENRKPTMFNTTDT